ncbi:helix-turn-helix domain-containing protein [Pontibacter mangrovi]|uniref:Helix-turn-helix domain-containing protein n=1 Tax=Pontibacter mangrovi TaxID=2589816 RepID=A0A501W2S5_9BACT|nr:helix-turn-helix domain-containing protein [Pontibacter mangrovi]TPE43578.1 helix-turn-helix domain-containing protein [Pontibacter mangrovi]
MIKKEIYSELLEKYSLQKSEAISFVNQRIGVAVDKAKMLETISANIDKLTILCSDLKLEIRLHEANPLFSINSQQFYTTKQAAEILNVSPDKIRQLIKNDILKTKKINQRNWKIPNWSLEAYKNDLCNFLANAKELVSEFAVVDVMDDENQLLISLITEVGIHQVHEHETRLKRTITGIRSEL